MSIRSIVRRIAAPTLVGALAATGLVAVSTAPSHAVTPLTTTTALTVSKKTNAYGQYLFLGGAVTGSDGRSPYEGTAFLQKKVPGGTWATVDSDTSPGYLYFTKEQRFNGNATYRVYYGGGTSSLYSWGGSYSNEVSVKTYRALTIKSRSSRGGPILNMKITPKAKKKITVERKLGGKWRVFKKVKTNKKGKVTVKVLGRTGTRVRLTVAGDKQFIKTRSVGRII